MKPDRIIFIPFVVLAYFFIHYATELWYFIEPIRFVISLVKYSIILFVLLLIGYKLVTNQQRFVLATCTLLFFFLFYGSFVDTGISVGLLLAVNRVDMQMVVVYLVICVLIAILSYRINIKWVPSILRFWMIYCVSLILYDLVSAAFKNFPEKKYLVKQVTIPTIRSKHKPPVFFILFDMYPSDTVLRKYFHFDNASYAAYLKQQGFFVSGNAHAVYNRTYYSLCSTLNLDTLVFDEDKKLDDYKKPLVALKKIEGATLPKAFEQAGYTFNNFSVFDIGKQPSPLRFTLNYHLNNALTGATFFNRFYQDFEPDFFQAYRNIDLNFFKPSWSTDVKADIHFLLKTFDAVVGKLPGDHPSFNYFHFMLPHPPVLYDSIGNELPVRERYAFTGFENSQHRFIEYTKYTNRLIRNMVDAIFKKAGKDVVIIIQGDHGYRGFESQFPDAVRYGAMNAVYLPGNNYNGFTDSMTTLSAFSTLLKNQFNVVYDTKY